MAHGGRKQVVAHPGRASARHHQPRAARPWIVFWSSAAMTTQFKDRNLLAVIGDEVRRCSDSNTGFWTWIDSGVDGRTL